MPRARRIEAIELRLSETPPCPRCEAPVLLVARYPHAWCNRVGERIDGLKEAVLCRSCDTRDLEAGGLLALFAGGGQLDAANLEAFGRLVHDWLNVVRDRVPNRADLEAEETRWRAGEL
ncbi:DUF6300 family protein [Streptomyces sp. NPDC058092]|uniref:DUF6300 family protein n=1 Tax=Streptomyces sp. NPDC058092 TaxID=3346336 RepID=UPI0036E8B1B9